MYNCNLCVEIYLMFTPQSSNGVLFHWVHLCWTAHPDSPISLCFTMSGLSYDWQFCNMNTAQIGRENNFFNWVTLSPLPPPPPQPASHPVPPVQAGGSASPVAPSCPCSALIVDSAWLPVCLVPTSMTTHNVAVSATVFNVMFSLGAIMEVRMIFWLRFNH